MRTSLIKAQVALQVLLAFAVIAAYQFESPIFTLSIQVFLGFAILSLIVHERYKLYLLILSFPVGLFFLYTPTQAFVFFAAFIACLLLTRLRLGLALRFGLLLSLCLLMFLLSRYFLRESRFSTVFSVLGSIFMLRSISFIRETHKTSTKSRWVEEVSFFAILPNCTLCFFPLIDFKTFIDGARHKRDPELLRYAIDTIIVGLLHLFIYRVLIAFWDIPLQEITSYGDFLHYLLVTYFHYIRISGVFHLIVGLLGLFGVKLPPTHIWYFFATNCLDLSRRINIYWKDFMAAQVYRPVERYLRATGPQIAAGVAVISVFVVSALMHPLINIWTRGNYSIRIEDWIFWISCGIWVSVNVLSSRRRRQQGEAKERSFIATSLKITLCFSFFSFLWAIWNSSNVGDLVALMRLSQLHEWSELLLLIPFLAVGTLGATYFHFFQKIKNSPTLLEGTPFPGYTFRRRDLFNTLALIFTLLLAYAPVGILGESYASAAKKITVNDNISEYEREKRSYDYYEGLKTSPLPSVDEDELPIDQQPYFESLNDYRRRQFRPNIKTQFMKHTLVTNRWGMPNSEDYDLIAKPNTIRIALFGASNSMSYGIDSDMDWPHQTEVNLNSIIGRKIEILNFSVIGYSALLAPLVFEEKIQKFHPDILVYAGVAREFYLNGFNVGYALRNDLRIPYPDLYGTLGIRQSDHFLARHYFTLPPFEKEKAVFDWGISKLVTLAKSQGIEMIYILNPTLYEGDEISHMRTRADGEYMLKKAQSLGFKTYDASELLNNLDLKEATLYDDVTHYNHISQRGHDDMAKFFTNHLSEYLRKRELKIK